MGRRLESALGVLNGMVGDYLARTGNGLATGMELVQHGQHLPVEQSALARALPAATSRAVLLAHGVMCTERVWEDPSGRDSGGGQDYGALLGRDLGYTPLYLRYNTGLAIAANGVKLAALLEALVDAWPVPLEELLLVGHSMGGLVVRSACQVARTNGHRWLRTVTRAIYLGTPHRGAPLERMGRSLAELLERVDDPYTQLVAEIGNLRSQGVKDLGDGGLGRHDRTSHSTSEHQPPPLLPEIRHFLVAGILADSDWLASLVGDALVPVASATGTEPAVPKHQIKVLPGIGHIALAHHPRVYASVRAWCEEAP